MDYICYSKISIHQKLLRLFFLDRDDHTGTLFKNLNILKFSDKAVPKNCLLISKFLHKTLLEIILNWFTVFLSFEFHTYNTRRANHGCITVVFHPTQTYGRYSLSINVIFVYIYFCKLFFGDHR